MLVRRVYSEANDLHKLKNEEIKSFKDSLLPKLSNTDILRLRDFTASDQSLQILPELINLTILSEFEMTAQSIGDETADAMAVALKNNARLLRLNFGGYHLTDFGLLTLGASIRKHPRLDEFCIVCGPAISDAALINFSLQVERNIHWTKKSIYGLIFSPTRSCQKMIVFLNNFFDLITQRNQQIRLADNFEEKIMFYNKFVSSWNASLAEKSYETRQFHLPDGIELDVFALKPWPQPKSLLEISLFNVKQYRQAKLINTNITLPSELEEKLLGLRN